MIQYIESSDDTDDADAYGWPPYSSDNRTDNGYGRGNMSDLSLIFAVAIFACTGLKVAAFFVDRYSRTRVVRNTIARETRDAIERVVVRKKVQMKSRVITQGGLGLASDLLNECPICLEEFSIGQEVTELSCHHPFHRDCLTLWVQENHTCPLCRLSV
jgi:hypothetical protein